jgi:hypothetical protein
VSDDQDHNRGEYPRCDSHQNDRVQPVAVAMRAYEPSEISRMSRLRGTSEEVAVSHVCPDKALPIPESLHSLPVDPRTGEEVEQREDGKDDA